MGFSQNSTFGFGGSGSGGGGGTVTGANNGLSLSGTNAVLGQNVGQAGNPAILLSNREIPMGTSSLQLTGIGKTSTTNFILEIDPTAVSTTPMILINDSSGNEISRINLPGFAGGSNSIYIGQSAGQSDTTSYSNNNNNIGIGFVALQNVTTGFGNVGLGYYTLNAATSAYENMAIGTQALNFLIDGSRNVAVGYNAAQNMPHGTSNVFIGHAAGPATYTGTFNENVYIGYQTGLGFFDGALSANDNTVIGALALRLQTYGNTNTVIGFSAFTDSAIGSNVIGIGDNLTASAAISNVVLIGSAIGTGVSNVVGIGRDDQNIILGQTAVVDNGVGKVQVAGNMTLATVNAAGGNPINNLVWDTVTGEVVYSGDVLTGANNGLSISVTNDVVLGQDIAASGDPAGLLSNREIPMSNHSFNFRGNATLNGTNGILLNPTGTVNLTGDTSTSPVEFTISDNNNGGSNSINLYLATRNFSALDFSTATNDWGLTFYDGTGNIGIGVIAQGDNGLANIQAYANMSVDISVNGSNGLPIIQFIQNASTTSDTTMMKFLDSSFNEISRINLPGIVNASNSIYIGQLAGQSDTTSYSVNNNNVGIGFSALSSVNTGFGNLALGAFSMRAGTNAAENIAVGTASLEALIDGSFNTAIGYNAGLDIVHGKRNTFIGGDSGPGPVGTSTIDYNIAIGFQAGVGFDSDPATFSPQNNVIIGSLAARFPEYGNKNVIIGDNAVSANIEFDNNNVFIGADIALGASVSNSTALGYGMTINSSNVAVIGRADQNILIGQTTSVDNGIAKLQVAGNMTLATVNAVGANPVVGLVWDTVTNEVLKASSSGSANNGLSIDPTSFDIILGQAIGASGNPAVLLANQEIPLGGFQLQFTGTTTANGTDLFKVADSLLQFTGDSSVNEILFQITDNNPASGISVQLGVIDGNGFLQANASTGISFYNGSGNIGIGQTLPGDQGYPVQVYDFGAGNTIALIGNGEGNGCSVVFVDSSDSSPVVYMNYANGVLQLFEPGGIYLGVSTSSQIVQIGTTAFANTGALLQVQGDLSLGSVPTTANPTTQLVYDTVTGIVSTSGAAGPSIRQVSANDSVLATDFTIIVDTSGGNITIDIDPTLVKGIVNIKKKGTDANSITLTNTIGSIYADAGAQTSYVFSNAGQATSIQSDGTDVYTV